MRTLVVMRHEFRRMFVSPLSWTLMGIMQLLVGAIFYTGLIGFMAKPDPLGLTLAVVQPSFAWAAVLMLFIIPLLSMRLIAEERREQTLILLSSAPLTTLEIVLGKFLSLFVYLIIMVAIMSLMPLSLLLGGTLDYGLWFTAALGLVLILSSFAAAGIFMSTLTQSPALAAITSFGLLLILWLFDLSAGSSSDNVLSYLSIYSHYLSMIDGVLRTEDIVYYLVFTTVFITLSVRRLEADRLGG